MGVPVTDWSVAGWCPSGRSWDQVAIRVWGVGRLLRACLVGLCALSQVCDVIVKPQVLIPKESHLLDQLIRSILRRVRWRWPWRTIPQGSSASPISSPGPAPVMSLLVVGPCKTWDIEGSGANPTWVGDPPNSRRWGETPGKRTPSHTGSHCSLSSQWRHSSSRRARCSSCS